MPDFNSFPTDNSSSTNLKYDIIASKFMTGIENHKRRNAASSTSSVEVIIYLIGAVLQLGFSLLVMVFLVLRWFWKRL
ncbi:MAG: hypothetical protein EOO51_00205 [Flavobacterium sp.]|nr:MAG: hypothetical protein EOO51_00205 [Flavobacterium sp.]